MDNKITMTFDEFDKLEEKASRFQMDYIWVPSHKDIQEKIIPHLDTYLLFILWLVSQDTKQMTDEQKDRIGEIQRILYDSIELTEEKEEQI